MKQEVTTAPLEYHIYVWGPVDNILAFDVTVTQDSLRAGVRNWLVTAKRWLSKEYHDFDVALIDLVGATFSVSREFADEEYEREKIGRMLENAYHGLRCPGSPPWPTSLGQLFEGVSIDTIIESRRKPCPRKTMS